MRAFISFVLLFLVFAPSVLSLDVPNEILNGYFPGRSPNSIVAPKTASSEDSVLFLESPSSEAFGSKTIQDKDIAHLTTHLLGLSPINISAPRPHFPSINFFERPLANLFIAFDSIGEDIFSRLSLTFDGQKIVVQKSFSPSNPLSELATIATGVTPSVHGIVSDSWNEDEIPIKAYDINGQSLTPNFAQHMDVQFEGESQILVGSGNKQMTAALCPSSFQLCVYWNSKAKKVITLPMKRTGKVDFKERDVILAFQEYKFFQDSKSLRAYYMKNDRVVRVLHGKTSVDFHLDDSRELNFLAELELLRAFRFDVPKRTPFRDGAPHLLAFVFTSLKDLIQAHGEDSHIVSIAARMVFEEVQETIAAFKGMFRGRVVSEVVLLGTSQPVPPLSSNLDLAKYEIHRIPQHRQVRSVEYSFPLNNTNTNATISLLDMMNFHVCLWVPIALALVLITFLWTMSEVGSGSNDTLLFSAGSRPHSN